MNEYSFVKDDQKVGFRWERVRCYNDQGEEVGFFDYDIQAPGWVTLQKLFVAKAFRNNGIASILIKHFLNLSFTKLSADFVSVYFFPSEKGISVNGLIKLFQKHGFEIIDDRLTDARGILKLQAFLNNNN